MKHPECSVCGCDQLLRDAYANWDHKKQDWVIHSVFDDFYCPDCEGETSIIWVEDEQ